MRNAWILMFALVFVATGALAGGGLCLQDQYGNQYNFVIDGPNKYVYGTVSQNQGCDAPEWVLIGSYVGNPLRLELTAANPLGDADGGCISEYKLKGNYPDFAWYYATGSGGQESTYVSCNGAVQQDGSLVGGLRR